jgi:hypothetical protein
VNAITAHVIEAISALIEALTETAHLLRMIVSDAEQTVAWLSTEHLGGASQQEANNSPPVTRLTYAAITQVQVPPRHMKVMVRSQGCEKQVLIDRTDNTGDESFQRLTERELVVKANTMVKLMGDLAVDKPDEGDLFMGAQREGSSTS